MTARERIEERRAAYQKELDHYSATSREIGYGIHLGLQIEELDFALAAIAEDEARTCGECRHFSYGDDHCGEPTGICSSIYTSACRVLAGECIVICREDAYGCPDWEAKDEEAKPNGGDTEL